MSFKRITITLSRDRKALDYRIEYPNVCYRYNGLKPHLLKTQMTCNLAWEHYETAVHDLMRTGAAQVSAA